MIVEENFFYKKVIRFAVTSTLVLSSIFSCGIDHTNQQVENLVVTRTDVTNVPGEQNATLVKSEEAVDTSSDLGSFTVKAVSKNVPYIRQYDIPGLTASQRNAACAPSSLSMFLNYIGKATSTGSTAYNLYKQFGTTTSSGTNRSAISPALKKYYGVDSTYTNSSIVSRIDAMLASGLPVPFRSYSIKKPNGYVFTSGHWVLITGRNGDSITVHDPEAGPNLKYSLNQMMKNDPGIIFIESKKAITYSYQLLDTVGKVRNSTWGRAVIDAKPSIAKSVLTFNVFKTDFPVVVFKEDSKVILKVGGKEVFNKTSVETTIPKVSLSKTISFDLASVDWPEAEKEYWIVVENKLGRAFVGPFRVRRVAN